MNPPARVRTRLFNQPSKLPLGHLGQQVVERVPVDQLQLSDARQYSTAEIVAYAEAIVELGFRRPVLAHRPARRVLYGDLDVLAARHLGEAEIDVAFVDDDCGPKAAAIRLLLEKSAAYGVVNEATLLAELELICAQQPDLLQFTGHSMPELDALLYKSLAPLLADDEQAATDAVQSGPSVTQLDDIWVWDSGSRLTNANARDPRVWERLMAGKVAAGACLDLPYGHENVSKTHPDWKDGCGLDHEGRLDLFHQILSPMLRHCRPGAAIYAFMDAKGLLALLTTMKALQVEMTALCAWDKGASARGGTYKAQIEHCFVGRWGKDPKARKPGSQRGQPHRTTLWTVPGYNQFRHDRKEALENHSCVKPQALLWDILLASTRRGDICIDPTAGSGSLILAADKVGRIAYACELEGHYCDIAVRRMHVQTGAWPVHEGLGVRFDEVEALRRRAPASDRER